MNAYRDYQFICVLPLRQSHHRMSPLTQLLAQHVRVLKSFTLIHEHVLTFRRALPLRHWGLLITHFVTYGVDGSLQF